jgi:hypothetical protein
MNWHSKSTIGWAPRETLETFPVTDAFERALGSRAINTHGRIFKNISKIRRSLAACLNRAIVGTMLLVRTSLQRRHSAIGYCSKTNVEEQHT